MPGDPYIYTIRLTDHGITCSGKVTADEFYKRWPEHHLKESIDGQTITEGYTVNIKSLMEQILSKDENITNALFPQTENLKGPVKTYEELTPKALDFLIQSLIKLQYDDDSLDSLIDQANQHKITIKDFRHLKNDPFLYNVHIRTEGWNRNYFAMTTETEFQKAWPDKNLKESIGGISIPDPEMTGYRYALTAKQVVKEYLEEQDNHLRGIFTLWENQTVVPKSYEQLTAKALQFLLNSIENLESNYETYISLRLEAKALDISYTDFYHQL